MGVIGPNNQLPRRRAGRARGGLHLTLYDDKEEHLSSNFHSSRASADKLSHPEVDSSGVSEALSLFPQPKSLLTRVIQVATSSNRIRVSSSFIFT